MSAPATIEYQSPYWLPSMLNTVLSLGLQQCGRYLLLRILLFSSESLHFLVSLMFYSILFIRGASPTLMM